MYEPRTYRQQFNLKRFYPLEIVHRETDLWVGIDTASYVPEMKDLIYNKMVSLRNRLDRFIHRYPDFQKSLVPLSLKDRSLAEANEMAEAAARAGIGPMSAVAGLFAREVGKAINKKFHVKELVVENGGDIFLQLKEDLVLSVFAGKSALSQKIGVVIPAKETPLGVCTSSGTVGPSLSFGKADAVMVACKSTTFADALATALGNEVHTANDINKVMRLSEKYPEILSLVIICEGKAGIRGKFEVKMVK